MYGSAPPLRDGLMSLGDGHALAYAEWGMSDGAPVLLFHGSPGCRLFCPDPDVTASVGVRLITIDRPGYGRSGPVPGYTLRHCAGDVERFLDALGIARVGVVGFSGGGKYALACAALIPDRVTAAAITAGAGASFDEWPDRFTDEDDRELARLVRKDRDRATEVAFAHPWVRGLVETPPERLREQAGEAPEVEMWFKDVHVRAPFDVMLREAMRQGPAGVATDWLVLVDVWGFDLKDVPAPITFFHGDHDPLVERADVDYVAKRIPDARVVAWADAGHMGLIPYWDEVLAAIV